MDQYTIGWADEDGVHTEGEYADGDAAAHAAHEAANLLQRPVRVLRPDGTTLMTVRPEAPTLVSVRRPRA